jgi:AcrR family transcriptional regulator
MSRPVAAIKELGAARWRQPDHAAPYGLILIIRLIKNMPMTSSNPPSQQPSNAEQTRLALVQAGLKLFGRQGFDGTSTREIAAAAKANIGSIAYHFGGKEGLHVACADFIVETMQRLAADALADEASAGQGADAVRLRLHRTAERMVGFFVASPEAGDIAQFVMRQLAMPGPALDRVYSGVFEPIHRRLCGLWEQATGMPAESEQTRLAVFTLIGQVVYFRIAREAVLRRMGWETIGPEQAGAITAAAIRNLDAMLDANRNEGTGGPR